MFSICAVVFSQIDNPCFVGSPWLLSIDPPCRLVRCTQAHKVVSLFEEAQGELQKPSGMNPKVVPWPVTWAYSQPSVWGLTWVTWHGSVMFCQGIVQVVSKRWTNGCSWFWWLNKSSCSSKASSFVRLHFDPFFLLTRKLDIFQNCWVSTCIPLTRFLRYLFLTQ